MWTVPSDLGSKLKFGKMQHPATFPLFLILSILFSCKLKKRAVVFDPYVGSGTTLKAAQLLGLKFLGCDVDETYVRMARERLAATNRCDENMYEIFQRMLDNDMLDLGKYYKKEDYSHLMQSP